MATEPDQFDEDQLLPKVIDLCDLASESPYAPHAFAFVQDGLRYTAHQLFVDPDRLREEGENLHVSGRQLALGLRDYAIKRYGLMARRVLEHWNIYRTDDFGRIVFRMIDSDLLARQDNDQIEDFFSVFSFDEAFRPEIILQAIESDPTSLESGAESLAGSSS